MLSNYVLLISPIVLGILYFIGNIKQFSAKKTNRFLDKHLNKVFYLFCLSVFLIEFTHIVHFLSNDFIYTVVYENSSINQSLFYKLVASYSGQSGSLLFWLVTVTIVGCFFIKSLKKYDEINRKFAYCAKALFIIFPLFLAISLLWNNPFMLTFTKYAKVYTDGCGLKLILQSPYNFLHPPLLFTGFALLYIPYIYAVTALICKEYLQKSKEVFWLKTAFQFNKIGLLCLAAGILMGSFWAYYSLGWGGFWGWDPIENAALIPMLLSVAFLHSSLIFFKNNNLLKTTLLIALLIFPTILLETFLARSGLIMKLSMHSYSGGDLYTYYVVFAFLLIIILGSLLIYFIRLKNLLNDYKVERKISKNISNSLLNLYAIVVLFCMTFVVFVGTCFPLIADVFHLNQMMITPSFYMNWFVPLSMLMLLLLGCSVFLNDIKNDFTTFSNKILFAFVLAIILLIISFYCGIVRLEYILLVFCCTFAFVSQLQNYIKIVRNTKSIAMRQLGATISHLGICIFIVAAMLYGNFERNQIVDLEAGKQKKVIDNYQLKSKNMILENNMNFVKYIVPIEVYDKHGNYVQNFYPYFTVPNNENLKLKIEMFPSVERIGMNDIYIEPMDYYAQNDTLQVNFSVKPFIIFVWCGGIMIVMGILLSLVPVKKQPVLQKKTNSSKS